MLVVTGACGVSSRSRSACMRTKATMVSLQKRRQSSMSAGLCGAGATFGIGTCGPVRHHLAPEARAHHVVETVDGLVFGLQPGVPVALSFLVEGRLHRMGADVVVNLPGDQLRMLAQRIRHGADDFFGVIPVKIAVEAAGVAGAFARGPALARPWAEFPDAL